MDRLPDTHLPPDGLPLALATSLLPASNTWTTTVVLSVASPLKVGVGSLDGVAMASSVTVGERVSTMKVRSSLNPGPLPNELSCSATALYSCLPSDRGGLACPDVQAPPVPVAAAAATSVSPEKILIVTGFVSLAVPLNVGVASLESAATGLNLTFGGEAITVKAISALVPVPVL